MPHRRLLPLCLLLLAAAAPGAEVAVCPAWELTVVDKAGRPLPGCAVLQMWGGHFRGVYMGSQTNAVTDAEGRVRFPARRLEVPAAPGRGQPGPVASIYVAHPGHRDAWISSHRDPAVTATRDGLRTRLVLEPQPAKP